MSGPPDEHVSPELALVDSSLRGDLTANLEHGDTTPAPAEVETAAVQPPAAPARARPRRRRGRTVIVVLLVLTAAAAAFILAGSGRLFGHDGGSSSGSTTAPAAAPAPRTFSWAPSAGASAYDFEIVRDGAIIYSTRTNEARVVVPARWTRGSTTQSLGPGSYRWYVWAVHGTGAASRRGPAIVSSAIEIPSP